MSDPKPTISGRTAVAYAHALRLREELGRWPRRRDLAASVGISIQSAGHYLRRLARAGLVEVYPPGCPVTGSAPGLTAAEQRARDVADAIREECGDGPTLADIACVLGVSRERVRQLLAGWNYRQAHTDRQNERNAAKRAAVTRLPLALARRRCP